ncbi:Uncharacterised protein [Mycobacteroides abscessus subsp. abscessus]|uniref:hypothetical protein n=1 Tax=Mycobacteroides abscessus TaxID=36809 RepID=UPI000926323D|nr:hypothetical protein [Mycobacteroides abscessus]SIM25505.1 Uncharacterised protein [Mycobacteroides abscessus subsp. abscessus]SLC78869.1 Uncharacterised protein [Mycobacteroides abscessus subsp. abscessus]
MLKTWETTLEQEASRFAGLDSQGVFADLAAGRYVASGDVMAAIAEVKRKYPNLGEELDGFKARVSADHSFWS